MSSLTRPRPSLTIASCVIVICIHAILLLAGPGVPITPVLADDCNSIAQYVGGADYDAGDVVQNNEQKYQCKPFPFDGWCDSVGYIPGVSPVWEDAWTLLGACDVIYAWYSGPYSACDCAADFVADSPPDTSARQRVVECRVDDGSIASNDAKQESLCNGTSKPSTTTPCSCVFEWSASDWEPCQGAPCGGFDGVQQRSVDCVSNETMIPIPPELNDDTLCAEASTPKPYSQQNCSTSDCPTYYWGALPWSKCSDSVQCRVDNETVGYQNRTIECRSNATHAVVSESFCLDTNVTTRPELSQECVVPPCPTRRERIIAYYANWDVYSRAFYANMIPFDDVTTIQYAFWDVDVNGNIRTLDNNADFTICPDYLANHSDSATCDTYNYKGNFKSLELLKLEHPDVELVLSLGGWSNSDHFSGVMNDAAKRENLCDSILSFCQTYPFFDGVDIDWEYPGKRGDSGTAFLPGVDGPNYVTFTQECGPRLKSEIPDRPLLFSLVVGCSPDLYLQPGAQVDYGALADYVDFVGVMSYDFAGSWDPLTGHQSPLFRNPNQPDQDRLNWTSAACVQGHIDAGLPAHKVVMGLATYGRNFANVAGNGPDLDGNLFSSFSGTAGGTWEAGINDYSELVSKYLPHNPVITDTHSMVPWIKNGTNLFGYDDVCSICNKCEYVKSQKLGGVLVWELASDMYDMSGMSLLHAMHCQINPSQCIDDHPCINPPNQGYDCRMMYSPNPHFALLKFNTSQTTTTELHLSYRTHASDGNVHCALVAENSPAPSFTQIMAGSGGGIVTSATASANDVYPGSTLVIPASALVGSTVYEAYCAVDLGSSHVFEAIPVLVTSAPSIPDVIAPSFSSLSIDNDSATSTSIMVDYACDESASVYCAAVADDASAPTVSQVKAGSGAGIVGAGATQSASSDSIVTVSGLTQLTSYDVYCVAEDASNNIQALVSPKLDASTSDAIAPSFTSLTVDDSSATSTSIMVDYVCDESASVYCAAVADDALAPTVSQVKAGSGAGIVGAGATQSASSDSSVTVSDLIQLTSYDVYCVAEDTHHNIQASVSTKIDVSTPDTTAPSFTSLTVNDSSATSTSIMVDYVCDESAIVYCAAVANDASSPTVSQIKAGTGGGVVGAGTTQSDSSDSSITVSGLTQLTSYDVYCVAEDAYNNTQVSVSVKLDASTSDTTAPSFTSLIVNDDAATSTTVSISFTADEPVNVYCAAVADDGLAPTVSQVKAGTGGGIVGDGATQGASSDSSLTVSDLTQLMSYDVYCVAEDASSNIQVSVSSKLDVSTPDTTAPSFTSLTVNDSSATSTSIMVDYVCDESVSVYCAAVANDASSPTVSQVKAGTGGGIVDAGATQSDSSDSSVTVSGLTQLTAYDVYCVAEDAYNNMQASISVKLDASTSDTTAPSFTSLTVDDSSATSTSITVHYVCDESASVYCAAVATDGLAPTVSQVKAGSSAGIVGAGATSSMSSDSSVTVSGLAQLTLYDVYCVAEDAYNNIQVSVSSKLEASTPDTTAPSFTSLIVNDSSATSTSIMVDYVCDESASVYCAAVANDAPSPTVSQVKAGTGGGIVGAGATQSDSSGSSVNVSDLTQLTSYDVYCVAEDAYNNTQASASSKLDASTSDTTAPSFTSLTVDDSSATSTSITVHYVCDESASVYCAAVADDALAPTVSQVKAGTGGGIVGAGATQSDSSGSSVTVSSLSQLTAYDVYCVAEDTYNNMQVSVSAKLDASTSDTTAPSFTSLTVNDSSATSHAVSVEYTTNEVVSVYCAAVANDALAPTVPQVKAGSGGGIVGAGATQSISSDSSVTVSGLTQLTSYDVYCVAEDAYSNMQASISVKLDASTSDTTAPSFTSLTVNDSSATSTSITVHYVCDEAASVHCAAVATDGLAPTVSQVKAGTGGGIVGAGATQSDSSDSSITVTGLTQLTAYEVYCVAEDAYNNMQVSVSSKLEASTSDTTAPSFTSLIVNDGAASSTSIMIDYMCDESASVYCVAVANGASAPSVSQVKAGSGGGIVGAGATQSDSSDSSITVTGLTQLTPYDVYCAAEDAYNNMQVSVSSKLDASTPDTTAPSFTSLIVNDGAATSTAVSIYFTADEPVRVYCAAVTDDASAPTVSQVKAGTDAGIVGSGVTSSSSSDSSVTVTGLTQLTSYDVYCVAQDTYNNIQAALSSKLDVSTSDTTAPSFTSLIVNDSVATSTEIYIAYSVDDSSNVYCAAVLDDAPAPTVSQVKAGTGGGIVAGTSSSTASTSGSIVLSTLSELTTYNVYCVAEDESNNIQVSVSAKLDASTSDTTAPSFTSLDVDDTAATSFSVRVTYISDELMRVYCVAVADNAPVPTVSQTKAGTGGSIVGSGSTSSASSNSSITVYGLRQLTQYDLYCVAEDTYNNIQGSVSSKRDALTSDTTAPLFTSLSVLTTAATPFSVRIDYVADELVNVYCAAVEENATPPTVSQVISGTGGGIISTAGTVTSLDDVSSASFLILSDLHHLTPYDVYCVAEDLYNNVQESVSSKLPALTRDLLAPTFTAEVTSISRAPRWLRVDLSVGRPCIVSCAALEISSVTPTYSILRNGSDSSSEFASYFSITVVSTSAYALRNLSPSTSYKVVCGAEDAEFSAYISSQLSITSVSTSPRQSHDRDQLSKYMSGHGILSDGAAVWWTVRNATDLERTVLARGTSLAQTENMSFGVDDFEMSSSADDYMLIDIVGQFRGAGYVSVGFSTSGKMVPAVALVATWTNNSLFDIVEYELTGYAQHLIIPIQQEYVLHKSVSRSNGMTTFSCTRPVSTPKLVIDVNGQSQKLIWAAGSSNILSNHGNGNIGSAQVDLAGNSRLSSPTSSDGSPGIIVIAAAIAAIVLIALGSYCLWRRCRCHCCKSKSKSSSAVAAAAASTAVSRTGAVAHRSLVNSASEPSCSDINQIQLDTIDPLPTASTETRVGHLHTSSSFMQIECQGESGDSETAAAGPGGEFDQDLGQSQVHIIAQQP
jgi:GH18 family chitinase